MDMGEVLKWGVVVVIGLMLLRWAASAFSGDGLGLQQTWQPNVYPYGVGGGVLYMQPPIVTARYPGRNHDGRGRRGR